MKTIHIIASVVAGILVIALVVFVLTQKPITAVAPVTDGQQQATTTTPTQPVPSTTVTTVTTVTTKPVATTTATTTAAVGTPITVRGSQVCLPFKDEDGVHIMLCAIGLKTTAGKYYSLHDTSADYSNLSKFSGEGTYEIKGTFTAKQDPTYVSEGVIDVQSVTKI